MTRRTALTTFLLALPAAWLAVATTPDAAPTPSPAAAVLRHPHFPKRVEMSLGFSPDAPKVAVSHLTVTFDRDGFAAMAEGGTWHLANGKLETGADIRVGGHDVAAGTYRLLARKTADSWELVLDPKGRDFSRDLSDEAFALTTEFRESPIRQEHLRIDLQPSGDAETLALHLEVHFDDYVATAVLEVPEGE